MWYYNYEDIVTPMQKVPASLDEMFQFRDETAVFPEYLKYTLSTDSGDGLTGANSGFLYMQGSYNSKQPAPVYQNRYGYGFLGKPDKSSSNFTINCPGELTMFARSKWSKQIIPVEGYYFDSLYINQNKDSIGSRAGIGAGRTHITTGQIGKRCWSKLISWLKTTALGCLSRSLKR